MLVDRVLADLDVPDSDERGGCSECGKPVSAKGLCLSHYGKARYAANREAIIARETARSLSRYWSDPEAGRARSRENQRRRRALDPSLSDRERRTWRAQNPERAREASRRNMRLYRQRHPERAVDSMRRWAEAHPEALRLARQRGFRKHYAAHPGVYAAKAIARRARKRAVAVELVDYDAVLIRCAGRCGICGEPVGPRGLHYDHIVPLAKGGAHSNDNLQVAHARCNLRKGARC